MKKLMVSLGVVMILISIIVPSFAEIKQTTNKEILFKNIPWGINIFKLREKMTQKGYSRSDKDNYNLEGGYELKYKNTNESKSKLFMVAGLEFEYVWAHCVWKVFEGEVNRNEKDSKFFLAGYSFLSAFKESTFSSLRKKLTELYGSPIEAPYPYKDIGKLFTSWYGANNTFVLLREDMIVYGKLGWEEEVEYFLDPENSRLGKEVKLKEEEKRKEEENKKLKEFEENFEGL